jgi:hypothetical protein
MKKSAEGIQPAKALQGQSVGEVFAHEVRAHFGVFRQESQPLIPQSVHQHRLSPKAAHAKSPIGHADVNARSSANGDKKTTGSSA